MAGEARLQIPCAMASPFAVAKDFCIREQQAAVAKELISASGNQLLQLNMGEGKPLGQIHQPAFA